MPNKQEKGLHLLYKNLGETPNERILRFKTDNPEYVDVSMTYAGRLDPMAEGLLLVVSGEEIKNKDNYLGLPKTYEVQVLWGFETDTLDLLGLVVESYKVRKVESEELEKMLEKSLGKFEQSYPAYSSKPVNGPALLGLRRTSKPLFQWAREGRIKEIEIPSHSVEIYEANFVERRTILKEELLVNLKFKIESVRGDFRQTEIWKKWFEELTQLDGSEFIIDTLTLNVSSGFYVRQFITDMAERLGTVAVTFHIVRTKIGEYTIADSIK